MDFINNYYINAFKKSFDYKSFTQRKEFNLFFLFYTIISFICFLIFFVNQVYLIISNAQIEIINKATIICYITMAIIAIIHIFPLLGLIKRRYNDISPSKSKLFFGIYIGVWITQMITGVTMMYSIYTSNGKFSIMYIIFGLLIQICNLFMMANWIFLMAKKGTAHIEKPENPPVFPIENL